MIWSVRASLIPIELVSNADYDLVSFCLIPIPIELTLNADYGTSVIASMSLNFSFQAVYNNLQALDYMLMIVLEADSSDDSSVMNEEGKQNLLTW